VKQHIVARVQATLRLAAFEQVLRRQPLEHHGRAGIKVDLSRQLAHALGRHHAQVAIAARRLAGVGHPVTHPQVRDALTHRLHHARGFHAQLHGKLHRVQAAALIHVNEIQPHGTVANPNLTRAGVAHRHLHQPQLFGAAMLVDADGA